VIATSSPGVRHRSRSVYALLLLPLVTSALLLFDGRALRWPARIALIALGAAAAIALGRRHDVPLRGAVVAVALAMTMATVVAPQNSGDVWSYEMYGRMIVDHHVSPFTHVPSQFTHDPFERRVSSAWRHTPSVYGPAFVVLASAGAAVAGSSAFLARLWFQLLAALALAGILVLVWRQTRNAGAVAALGLHPIVVLALVNAGKNDLLVGLAVLAAVIAVRRRNPGLAGVAIGIGTLVKLTCGLALIGLLPFAWRQRGRRDAMQLASAAAATVGLGCIGSGLTPFSATGSNATLVSRASPWQLARLLFGMNRPLHPWTDLPSHAVLAVVSSLGVATVVLLALLTARARRGDAAAATGGALAAYSVAAPYALAAYAGWWLPTTMLAPERRSNVFLAWYAAVAFACYQIPHQLLADADTSVSVLVTYAVPTVAVVLFVRHVVRERAATA
jgi:Glycosyltransferase family 87